MTFSIGLWDSLFGKRVTLEIPNSCGQVVKRSVTKKWLECMQREEKPVSEETRIVKVHMLDASNGYRLLCWMINDDVEETTANMHRDPDTGDLYAIHYLDEGENRTEILNKHCWDMAYQKLCNPRY